MITLYHNPRCSKSRAAKEMLEARGVRFETVLYLEAPPSRETIEALMAKSDDPPAAFVRSGDGAFKEQGLVLPQDARDIAELLAKYPGFLQRPILAVGDAVVIGRPTERIREALEGAGL